jgi:hypothetical protein
MTNRQITGALLLVLSLLAASVAAGGCGSAGEAQAAPTKEQYQKQASKICSRASNDIYKKAGDYLSQNPQGSKAELYRRAGVPPLEQAYEDLKALPVPREDEAGIEAFIEKFSEAVEKVTDDPSMIVGHPNPFSGARRLAKKHQLGDCGVLP